MLRTRAVAVHGEVVLVLCRDLGYSTIYSTIETTLCTTLYTTLYTHIYTTINTIALEQRNGVAVHVEVVLVLRRDLGERGGQRHGVGRRSGGAHVREACLQRRAAE